MHIFNPVGGVKLKKIILLITLLMTVVTPVFAGSTNILSEETKRESLIMDVLEETAEMYLIKQEYYDKITPWMKGNLEGLEMIFIDYALEVGVDPVLAISISLQETGHGESFLCKTKNNFGGMRYNGEWLSYETREEGATKFIDLIAKYTARGMDTPETMVDKYAEGSETWAIAINRFMKKINTTENNEK